MLGVEIFGILNQNKMTAVEWLESEFNKWAEGGLFIPPHIITQAKKFEKEQMDNAWDRGYKQGYYDPEFEKENIED
jgi:hypothetical protein